MMIVMVTVMTVMMIVMVVMLAMMMSMMLMMPVLLMMRTYALIHPSPFVNFFMDMKLQSNSGLLNQMAVILQICATPGFSNGVFAA